MTTHEIREALWATKGDVVAAAQLVASGKKRLASEVDSMPAGEPPLQQPRTKMAPVVWSQKQKIKTLKIPEDCEYEKRYVYVTDIGKGAYGTVSKVRHGGKIYAMKLIQIHTPKLIDDLSDFQEEILITIKAAHLGVAPKIFDYGICKYQDPYIEKDLEGNTTTEIYGEYFIIQELLEDTWFELFTEEDDSADDWIEILELQRTLLENGIQHADLHSENIMKGGDRFYIVDYGQAGFIHKNQISTEANDIKNYTRYMYYWVRNFYPHLLKIVSEGPPYNLNRMNAVDRSLFWEIEEKFFRKYWPELYRS